KVDIIVARTNGPIQAAMSATRTIPIVMLNGNYPVEAGFVGSLARPGGNVTGTSYVVSGEIYAKHPPILKELAPATDRIAVLRTAQSVDFPMRRAMQRSLEPAAMRLGMTVRYFEVRQPEEVQAALDALRASGIKAMVYVGGPILRTRTDQI